jgi:hypothetical protein
LDYGSRNVSVTKIQTQIGNREIMVHCTECGREQADMAKFCRYCGERMPGLDLVMKLKQEAAAIQRAKSGSRNPPQTPPNPQQPVNDPFRTGRRLGGA